MHGQCKTNNDDYTLYEDTTVFKGEDGFLRIRMEDMFYALVNAVKELDLKIETLKNKDIAELKTKVTNLERENAELQKRIAILEKKVK